MLNTNVKIFRTKKAKIKIAREVCDAYATGKYTLESCCACEGVKYATFRNWGAPTIDFDQLSDNQKKRILKRGFVPEVHTLIKRAKAEADRRICEEKKMLLRRMAKKLLQGYEYEEVTEYYLFDDNDSPYLDRIVKVTKHVPPNVNIVIFLAKTIGL